MRKQITFPILVTLLFLTILFSDITNQVKANDINATDADLPEWSVGNFWEYDFYINAISIVRISVSSLEFKVDSVSLNEYNMRLFGCVDELIYGTYDYSGLVPYVTGNAIIDRSSLAINNCKLIFTGIIDLVLEIGFNPDLFDFPLTINKQWSINSNFMLSVMENNVLDTPITNTLKVSLSDLYEGYDSFLITGGDLNKLWYSPDVGFIVSLDTSVEVLKSILLELSATNFNHMADAPNIATIQGPASGKYGEVNQYNVSTTDDQGDQVFYKVDWGDRTQSDWLGPYDSGEPVVINHKWQKKGDYNIRVKAKDINNFQTVWSAPYPVSMPRRISLFNGPFMTFLQNRPGLSTFFRLLFQLIPT